MNNEINWNASVCDILEQIQPTLQKICSGTKYSATRNSTHNEKSIDLFVEGYPKRVGHIWPHPQNKSFDVVLRIDLVNKAKERILLPDGAFFNGPKTMYEFKKVSFSQTIEIMSAALGKSICDDKSIVSQTFLDDSHSMEDREEHAASLDLVSLKAAALAKSSIDVAKYESKVTQYVRNPYISEYAKRRANGVCQLCGKDAPFIDKDGNPYLEVHHIIWLSRGGEDSIHNTVALCPNCHRKMHIVDDKNDLRLLVMLNSKIDQ